MILVNTPGDGRFVYWPLQHAEWHGWTPTDCVFPSFVWIVGVALTLSLGRKTDASAASLHLSILRRAAILFGLGVFLYAVPTFPLDTFRILGVLQRIAICYLVSAILFLHTGWKGQLVAAGGLMGVYWALMAAFGDYTVDGNFAHTVDRIVLGAHNYGQTKTWDPEGILSTLPAIATCLLGVLTGHVLKASSDVNEQTRRLLLIGAVLLGLGLLLDPVLPINKKLWTPSFTLFMAGLDSLIYGAMLWVVDGQKIVAPFRPFLIMGMNAIALYLSSEFLDILINVTKWKIALMESVFLKIAAPINASLMFSVCYVLFHLALGYALYRRKWFLRV